MTSPPVPAKGHATAYRPDIDGLRAIAVISVVLYHGWPRIFGGGFIGVDIFFVISGYLITSIIVSQLAEGRFSIIDFYARRIRRIFPALLLVLLATVAFGWFTLLPAEFKQVGKHIAAGGTFISNLVLWNEAGYFDNAANTKPLLHLWSLGIEEQFYVIWPLLLWIVCKRKINFFYLIGFVFLLSMGANLALVRSDPVAAFYSPATRFWELMAGGIAAQLNLRGNAWPGAARQAASVTGGALLLCGFLLIREQDPFPGWWALLPVCGAFLLIMAGPGALLNRLLSIRLAVWTGLISYPLYLWHWPLLAYGYIVFGEKPPLFVRAALIVAAFALAVLTYRLVELPLRAFFARTRITAGLAGGMVAAVVAGILVTSGTIRERINANGADVYLNALNDSDFPGQTFVPFRHQNRLFQKVSSRTPGVTIFLGDSVVEHYGPYVESAIANAPDRFNSAVFATAGSCPPIRNAIPLPQVRYGMCPPTVEAAYDFASRPEVDTVVIGAAWYGYFSDNNDELLIDTGTAKLAFPKPDAKAAAYQSLERNIALLKKKGKRVFLLLQPPMGPAFDPRNMYAGSRFGSIRPVAKIEPVKLDRFRAANSGPYEQLIRLARAAGAQVIDPTRFLCADNVCPVLGTDGEPAYTDTMHMRPRYSRSAAGYLAQTLLRSDRCGQEAHHTAASEHPSSR